MIILALKAVAWIAAMLIFPQRVASEAFASYSVYDDASWAVLDAELDDGVLGSDRQGIYNDFIRKCETSAGDNAEHTCHRDESYRMHMNMYQPRSVYNFTKTGFKKIRAPDSLMELINFFWETNKGYQKTEWGTATPYHNTWDTEPTIIALENNELVGGGYALRAKIANFVRDAMEEWTNMQQAISSVYGIRSYHNGSILAPHVDRLPLVSSAILNVAQDVEEDWPLEVYDHNGRAHNVTMKPGDLVLYESHSVIHGRPFALKGNLYANIFVHFEPIGPISASDNVEIVNDGIRYPPYIIPGTSWEPEWRMSNPNGWNLLEDASRLFLDGDLKTIRYAAQIHPSLLHGSEKWKPIHEAVRHGHYDIVKYLVLEAGISIYSECEEYSGRPLDVARQFLGSDDPITALLTMLHEEAGDQVEGEYAPTSGEIEDQENYEPGETDLDDSKQLQDGFENGINAESQDESEL